MDEKYGVVISGMSGRFPDCDSVEEFRQKLFSKENLITVDNRRWSPGYKYNLGRETVPSGTGKFRDIASLDARFFQIHHILVNCCDVVIRKILEPTVEAIIDAGVNPATISGSHIGVYTGFMISEADAVKAYERHNDRSMFLIGSSKTMMANRISFSLNLTGPSFTSASSYHGGIEAMGMAFKHITEGRVEAAIIGVINSIVDPKLSLHYGRLGFLSPDGLCRAFDENANGYGRSEAAVVLFLQRADVARRIYGTILYADSIYLGTNTCTCIAVNENTVEKSLEKIYNKTEVDPKEVSFLEMNAPGIQWLDSVESNAVENIFCKNRETSLLVGSVKSNVGHTEGAAAFVSMVKALIALDSNCIPPNMNFTKPNPKIKPLISEKLKVVTEKTPLPGPVIAVNSIGLSGGVAHAIIRQNPKIPKKESRMSDGLPRLVLLFGRTDEGIKNAISKMESTAFNKDFIALANDVFKVHMQSQVYRGYTVLPAHTKTVNGYDAVAETDRPIWFLFSGMGSQWNAMGEDLLKIPIFASAIDKVDAVMKPRGIDIKEILTSKEPTLFDNITNALVGITAVQIGLVDVLRAIGIKPDGLIGHSVGETACAYADGCFTAEEAVLSSYSRGIASLEIETVRGLMAAVGKGYEQMKDNVPEGIEIACRNSKDNCTLSGPEYKVSDFVEQLKSDGVFAKAVNTANIAYHSSYIGPAAPLLLKYLKEVIPEPKLRSSKWISTSVPESEWETPAGKYCSAEYHTNNFMKPVLFEEGCKHIPENAIVIEIAPHGLLQAIVRRSLNKRCTNIPLMLKSKSTDGVTYLISAIGKMYVAGCQPDINSLYPKVEYPVPRDTPNLASFVSWDHYDKWDIVEPLKDKPISQEPIEVRLNKGTEYSYLGFHKVHQQCIIPPSFYMYLAWHMLAVYRNEKVGQFNVVFENIKVHKNLTVALEKFRCFTVLIQYGSGSFEVLLENEEDEDDVTVLMTGQIIVPYEQINVHINDTFYEVAKHRVTRNKFYNTFQNVGFALEDIFSNVHEIVHSDTELYGKIVWNENWVSFLDALMKIHMHDDQSGKQEVLYPNRILRLAINADTFKTLKSGDMVLCHKDRITNSLWCEGLEMRGFKYRPLELDLTVKESRVELRGLRFIPFLDPFFQSQLTFVSFCLQLMIDNVPLMSNDDNAKLHIADVPNSELISQIKKVVKLIPDMKKKITFYKSTEFLSNKKAYSNKCHLITMNEVSDIREEIDSLNRCELDRLFVLVTVPSKQLPQCIYSSPFVVITKETFSDVTVMLLKKVSYKMSPKIVIVGNNLKLKTTSNELQPTVLVWEKKSVDTFEILSKPPVPLRARSILILDEAAPTFSQENPLYKSQLLQDLPVSVLKDGYWGTYQDVTRNENIFNNETKDLSADDLIPSDIRLENVDIHYLTVDKEYVFTDKTKTNEGKEYGLEYSGITNKGERVMGLAVHNSLNPTAKPDPYFTWSLPDDWTLEDAVTVPYIYTLAYYAMLLSPKRGGVRSALIHCADTVLGEACLNLLLHNKEYNPIFVTVATEQNADALKSRFPSISHEHVLLHTDPLYDVKIKLRTGGKGVGFVVNSLPGIEHVNASLECSAFFSNYIDIIDTKSKSDVDLGLFAFLKSISMSAVCNKIASLTKLHVEEKQQLYLFMKEGIASGAVKPLRRDVYMQQELHNCMLDRLPDVKKVVRLVGDSERLLSSTPRKMRYSNEYSYIIVGSGKKPNLWMELMEWLIERGARKFVVVIDTFTVSSKLSHQINKLIGLKKATIVLTSAKKLESIDEACKIITDARNVAPLDAIFFVSETDENKIQNMDSASRLFGQCHFITVLSKGLHVCERRRNIGLPGIAINIKKPENKLSPLLPHLEKLMSRVDNNNDPVLYDFVNEKPNESEALNVVTIETFIPFDAKSLEAGGRIIRGNAYFEEVRTLAVPYTESKGVYPIFVIPGMDGAYLKPVIRRFLYPAFCASLPASFDSIDAVVFQLLKHMQEIQSEGPVTLIGETWSGCIAIELTSLLQSSGRNVKLFLIEGSPTMWQNVLKDSMNLENSLVKQILHFKLPVGCKNNSSKSWNEFLSKFSPVEMDQSEKKHITDAISSLRCRFKTVANYTPKREPLKHVIHFKQSNTIPHNPLLEQYCLSDDVYQFDDEKYEKFVKNPGILHIINDSALFSWNFKMT